MKMAADVFWQEVALLQELGDGAEVGCTVDAVRIGQGQAAVVAAQPYDDLRQLWQLLGGAYLRRLLDEVHDAAVEVLSKVVGVASAMRKSCW